MTRGFLIKVIDILSRGWYTVLMENRDRGNWFEPDGRIKMWYPGHEHFEYLPREFEDKVCRCMGNRRGFTMVPERGEQYWVCGECLKPVPIIGICILECENCENFYMPDKLPDEMLLCQGCLGFN